MGDRRTITSMLVVISGLVVAACSTLDASDYCRYSEEQSIRAADPVSLALVLGTRPERTRASPFVVFRSLSESSPEATVTLAATAEPHNLPMHLDESRCAGVDWSTYTLAVDSAEWEAFWSDERTSNFEVAIAFLDHGEPLSVNAFGAAIVDTTSSDYLVACGCYWN